MLNPKHRAAIYGSYTDPPQEHYESEHMANSAAWRDVAPQEHDPVTILLIRFAASAADLGNGSRGDAEKGRPRSHGRASSSQRAVSRSMGGIRTDANISSDERQK